MQIILAVRKKNIKVSMLALRNCGDFSVIATRRCFQAGDTERMFWHACVGLVCVAARRSTTITSLFFCGVWCAW